MEEIYLVIEFDSKLIYIPFRNLENVDNFTSTFDNQLELAAKINYILELNIPNEEILDVYLSESIDKIYDDTQEFKKPYLHVMYRRDNFNKSELETKFTNYITYNINDISNFIGLKQVIENYRNKNRKDGILLDKDMIKIAKAYIGIDYKRTKECYYILKDKKYKFNIPNRNIDYSNLEELDKEDRDLLVMSTNMKIDELKEYVNSQNKGKTK